MNDTRQPCTPDHWRHAVILTHRLPPQVKVTMLAVVDYMTPDGRLCTPRTTFAKLTGRSEKTVTRHFASAVEVGYLQHLLRGHNGFTAVYRACLPALSDDRDDR